MDLQAIVQAIDDAIERLQRARSLLTGHMAPLKRGLPAPKAANDEPRKVGRELLLLRGRDGLQRGEGSRLSLAANGAALLNR
jgi:hypothetical protein